jgi:hypothetical protein
MDYVLGQHEIQQWILNEWQAAPQALLALA